MCLFSTLFAAGSLQFCVGVFATFACVAGKSLAHPNPTGPISPASGHRKGASDTKEEGRHLSPPPGKKSAQTPTPAGKSLSDKPLCDEAASARAGEVRSTPREAPPRHNSPPTAPTQSSEYWLGAVRGFPLVPARRGISMACCAFNDHGVPAHSCLRVGPRQRRPHPQPRSRANQQPPPHTHIIPRRRLYFRSDKMRTCRRAPVTERRAASGSATAGYLTSKLDFSSSDHWPCRSWTPRLDTHTAP